MRDKIVQFLVVFGQKLIHFIQPKKKITPMGEATKSTLTEAVEYLDSFYPKLCVVATSSLDGKPQCAVMAYSVLEDLTIILSTDNFTRKWQNLNENNHIALTFGWSYEKLNVQLEGTAELIDEPDGIEIYGNIYFKDHPEALEFRNLPETVFIKVKPNWVRLSDYLIKPPRFEETKIEAE